MDMSFKTYCKLFVVVLAGALIVVTLPVGVAVGLTILNVNPFLAFVSAILPSFISIWGGLKFLNNRKIHDWVFQDEDRKQ